MKKNWFASTLLATVLFICAGGASEAQQMPVYRGIVKYPDFAGREKAYAYMRTRIVEEMRTGPNFAGHFAILQFGCGTGCSFALVADVSTGRIHEFPYGGEVYQTMTLTYNVKNDRVSVKWVNQQGQCEGDDMLWNGSRFLSQNRRVIGSRSLCLE